MLADLLARYRHLPSPLFARSMRVRHMCPPIAKVQRIARSSAVLKSKKEPAQTIARTDTQIRLCVGWVTRLACDTEYLSIQGVPKIGIGDIFLAPVAAPKARPAVSMEPSVATELQSAGRRLSRSEVSCTALH